MTDTRFDLFSSELMMGFVRRFNGASQVVAESSLPGPVQELVKIRASQINGCGMCTDMHVKDALAAGEDQTRLFLVAAWREATVFTEAPASRTPPPVSATTPGRPCASTTTRSRSPP
jgi:AhpD family alkylhydroperoxidase